MTDSEAPVGVRHRLTPNRALDQRTHLFELAAIAGIGSLIAAIAVGRPEIVALGAPFLVSIALALVARTRPDAAVELWCPDHATEGDEVSLEIDLQANVAAARIEVEIDAGDRLIPTGATKAVTSLDGATNQRLSFGFRADDWGVASLGDLSVRVCDRFGYFGGRMTFNLDESVRIGLPIERHRRRTLDATRFRRIVGSHLSDGRGDGQEIADIRPWQPGDSAKLINWRISNRRQEPWVTLRHPDRSTTVILVVDAHDEAGSEHRDAQRRTAAAAMALTRSHLDQHDRVGLLVVGHTLGWLPPQLGRDHLWRIADQLVAVGNAPSASMRMYRPRAVKHIPSDAIVVVLSPLIDPLMVRLTAELLSRGNPVSVLRPPIEAPGARSFLPRRPIDRQAQLLAGIEQRAGVASLRERGAVVIDWAQAMPVDSALAQLSRARTAIARAR